ncbi:unnamed protein product [Amaranthus hypochondriacus]
MQDSQKNALPEKESSHSPLQLVEFEGTQTPRTITQVTPNGSTVWIPHCDLDKKPIVGLAQRSESDLQSLLQNLKEISRKLKESDYVRVEITKEQQIELLVGSGSSSTMEIQNPIQSKNKGKRQRIIGKKELNIEQSKKPKRKCKTCGKFDYHDSQNCPSTNDLSLKFFWDGSFCPLRVFEEHLGLAAYWLKVGVFSVGHIGLVVLVVGGFFYIGGLSSPVLCFGVVLEFFGEGMWLLGVGRGAFLVFLEHTVFDGGGWRFVLEFGVFS